MANTYGNRHVLMPTVLNSTFTDTRHVTAVTLAATGAVLTTATVILREAGAADPWLQAEMVSNQTIRIKFARPQVVRGLQLAVRDDPDCKAYIYFA